ncbi:MAG: TIGR03435 family protein [Bryobacteraceae bacterium]
MARTFRALGLFVSCLLLAQAPPAFTVASIKPNRSSDDRFMLRPMPGGGLTATGVTLKMLIMNAYGIAVYQISGAPNWVGTERWDIDAKTEGVQGLLPPAQFNVLLRHLIEERFQLKSHRKSKKLPAYALVVMKTGSKLKPHAADSTVRPTGRFGFGSASFTNMPVADLAKQLSFDLGRPVLDRTGLAGSFDFSLEWTPASNEGGAEAFGLPPRAEPPTPVDSNRPSLFTALEEQLGLKLQSTKSPVDILVIDRVERASQN